MTEIKSCIWCGGSVTKGTLCDSCKKMNSFYNTNRPRLFHTTPINRLLKFRNICMDMINYREHGRTGIPEDVDYQLERVNRYINERT